MTYAKRTHSGARGWATANGPIRARGLGQLKPDADDHARHHTGKPERLLASCWCERGYVRVDSTELLAGRTASCGRRDCRAPVQRRAEG